MVGTNCTGSQTKVSPRSSPTTGIVVPCPHPSSRPFPTPACGCSLIGVNTWPGPPMSRTSRRPSCAVRLERPPSGKRPSRRLARPWPTDKEIATLDWRDRYRSAQEASAEYQAAKQKAVRSGRLWGRWTEGHRTARLREGELKTIYETTRQEADAQRRAGDSMDWLSEHLVGRTQFVANQTSMHCVGSSCVGVFEDEIGVRDVRRMAAAVVIGQVTAGLMLEALISADSYRRLLNPWRTSVGREPWQADG